MSKQDRQGPRTPAQLEQRYRFGQTFAQAMGLAEEAKDTAERAVEEAEKKAEEVVDGMTQEEVFNKLTENGKMKGLFMKDGQLYINADYLATGVIKSADGTVQLDLANNTVTINGTRDGYKTQIVLSSSSLSAYGESKEGVMEHVLEFQFGVGGKPTAILNNAWNESLGMIIASAAGVFSLGTSEASTEIWGSYIDINPIMDLNIMKKTTFWKNNGDGTYTLMGR